MRDAKVRPGIAQVQGYSHVLNVVACHGKTELEPSPRAQQAAAAKKKIVTEKGVERGRGGGNGGTRFGQRGFGSACSLQWCNAMRELCEARHTYTSTHTRSFPDRRRQP